MRNFILIILFLAIVVIVAYFVSPDFKKIINRYFGPNTTNQIDSQLGLWGGEAEDTYIKSLTYGSGINSGNIRRFTEVRLDEFLAVLKEKDVNGLKKMLSSRTASTPGVLTAIGGILDFIDGDIIQCSYKTHISYDMVGSDVPSYDTTETISASGTAIISKEGFFFKTEKQQYYCWVEFMCRDDRNKNEGLGVKKIIIGTIAAATMEDTEEYCVKLNTTSANGYDLIDYNVYQISNSNAFVTYEHAVNNYINSSNRSWSVFLKLLGEPYVDTYWEKIYKVSDKPGYYLKIELAKENLQSGAPDTIYRMSIVNSGVGQ